MACSTCQEKRLQRLRDYAKEDPSVAALVEQGIAMAQAQPTGEHYNSPIVATEDYVADPASPPVIMVLGPEGGFPRPIRPGEEIWYDPKGRARVG